MKRIEVELSYTRIMWRIFILLVIMGGFLGCNREAKPKDVLPEAEMVKVIIQLHLAEEKMARLNVSYDSMNKLMPYLRDYILEQVGTRDSLFKKSMEYYMAHPKRMEYIYTAVVDSLSLQEQVLSKERTDPHALPQ
ncbi:MAG: DUF4296 domain-containing protein [Cyclobacteriaceae bacterium]|nr:DUF4296 domain-containing protein [Cyclobacteriaceae bacterium]